MTESPCFVVAGMAMIDEPAHVNVTTFAGDGTVLLTFDLREGGDLGQIMIGLSPNPDLVPYRQAEARHMTDLLRCPFCGEAPVLSTIEGHMVLVAYVECPACLCRGPRSREPDEAARLWNERAEAEA